MMLDASKERIPGIIADRKHRLEELARPEVWTRYTKNMECGEYKEFKQSCIDDEIIIAALEKQTPKKVNISIKGTTGWNTKCHCPNCRSYISKGKYCSECGQALDWGDT